jgi:hypothetical protein
MTERAKPGTYPGIDMERATALAAELRDAGSDMEAIARARELSPHDKGELMQPEIANKGRIWACLGCGRIAPSAGDLLAAGCEGKPEPFLSLPDLKNLLTELADEYETHAATWDEVAQSREGQDKLFAAGMARGRSLIFEEAASELRHLITEQLGEER